MQAVGTVPCFVFAVPADSPHDHDSTSISPLCTLSVDSPWMPSTFRNMSTAAMALVDASAVAASTPAVNKPFQLRRFIVVLSKESGRISARTRERSRTGFRTPFAAISDPYVFDWGSRPALVYTRAAARES